MQCRLNVINNEILTNPSIKFTEVVNKIETAKRSPKQKRNKQKSYQLCNLSLNQGIHLTQCICGVFTGNWIRKLVHIPIFLERFREMTLLKKDTEEVEIFCKVL